MTCGSALAPATRDRGAISRGACRRAVRAGGLVLLGTALACNRGRVSFLPRLEGTKRAKTEQVELLFSVPARPYTELGLITVESPKWDEGEMASKLRERARAVGADAVLMSRPTLVPGGASGSALAVSPGFVMSRSENTGVRRLEGLAVIYTDNQNSQ